MSLLHRIDEDSLLFALRGFLTNDEVGPRDYMNLACASKHAHAFVDKHWQFLKPDTGAGHRARFVRELEEYNRKHLEDDLPLFPRMDQMRQLVVHETNRAPPPPLLLHSSLSAPQQYELDIVAGRPTPLPRFPGRVVTSIRLMRSSSYDTSVRLLIDGITLVRLSGDLFPLFADPNDGSLELMQFVRYLPQTPLDQVLLLWVNRDAVVVVTGDIFGPEQQQQQQQWWVRAYQSFCETMLDGACSIRSILPINGVAECVFFHMIDDAGTTTRTAEVVPSSFTLELNGKRFTIPAWPCRQRKKDSSGSSASESLRYYYRIPIDKRINLSNINNIRVHAHFYPRPAAVRRVGQVRFQVGALVYNVLRTGPVGFVEVMDTLV